MNNSERTGFLITNEMISKAKIGRGMTIRQLEKAIVLTKTEMTALDLVQTISSLESIILEFYKVLVDRFPVTENCDFCRNCEGNYGLDIKLPKWALDEIGVETEAKLDIFVDEENGQIVLEPKEYDHDLSDISAEMKQQLSDMGVCLGDLEESIIVEEIIYED